MSESNTLAKGTAKNVKFRKPEGKEYHVCDLEVKTADGVQKFTGIYKRPKDLKDGMPVQIVESQNERGRMEKVIEQMEGAKETSQPSRSSGGSEYSGSKDERISRMAALNTANAFLSMVTAADTEGKAIKKGVRSNPDLMFQLLGKYANLFYTAAQDGAFFEGMPDYDGNVGEVGDDSEEDKPVKKTVKKSVSEDEEND